MHICACMCVCMYMKNVLVQRGTIVAQRFEEKNKEKWNSLLASRLRNVSRARILFLSLYLSFSFSLSLLFFSGNYFANIFISISLAYLVFFPLLLVLLLSPLPHCFVISLFVYIYASPLKIYARL